ncbi:MAG: peptidylprolyl isomerase [Sediminibacterium sp.]|nr:peptidylprolyl isomerase [Sediminibacterium sp.]
MKKILLFSCLFISLSLAAQKTAPKPGTTTPTIKLKTYSDSIQYALGTYMADVMLKGGFMQINLNYFLAGLNDVYKQQPRQIRDSIAYVMVQNFQADMVKLRGKALETELFNALKDKPGVGKLPSGVQYLVIKPGTGQRPLETDSVLIHYKGSLANGDVFENTFTKNLPILTTPATLIAGLKEVLPMMPVGSTWQIFIPASMGYGTAGTNNIPPNSALLITAELVEIRKH